MILEGKLYCNLLVTSHFVRNLSFGVIGVCLDIIFALANSVYALAKCVYLHPLDFFLFGLPSFFEMVRPGNTKGESITVPLTSCFTCLESVV